MGISGGSFEAAQALDRGVVLQHHSRRHSAALPVIDALLAARLLVDAKESGEGSVPACGVDDLGGFVCVHDGEY